MNTNKFESAVKRLRGINKSLQGGNCDPNALREEVVAALDDLKQHAKEKQPAYKRYAAQKPVDWARRYRVQQEKTKKK